MRSPATWSARLPSDAALRALSSAHLKQLIKKIGEEKAMAMLEKSEQGFKENYALLKKLSEM